MTDKNVTPKKRKNNIGRNRKSKLTKEDYVMISLYKSMGYADKEIAEVIGYCPTWFSTLKGKDAELKKALTEDNRTPAEKLVQALCLNNILNGVIDGDIGLSKWLLEKSKWTSGEWTGTEAAPNPDAPRESIKIEFVEPKDQE